MTSILKVSSIQDPTNSNTAMSIDTSGRVTTPARPAFRVYGALTAWVSFSSNVKVDNLTTVDYNIGSHYSTSDHEFTVPIAGLYHFSGHIYVNNTATMSDFYLSVDDAAFTGHLYFASQDNDQSDSTVTFAETLQLTANQTVSIKGNSGQYYPAFSSFGGYLIG